jgi:hypothetical protein
MKYYLFNRESNKFDDILKDSGLKNAIRHKIQFRDHLILGFDDSAEKVLSYLTIKYGDNIISFSYLIPNRTPVPYKDYIPQKISGIE